MLASQWFAAILVVALSLATAPVPSPAVNAEAQAGTTTPELRADWTFFRSPVFQVYGNKFQGEDELAVTIGATTPIAKLVDLVGWGFEPDNYFKKMRYPDAFIRTPCNFNTVSDNSLVLLDNHTMEDEVYEMYGAALAGENYQRISCLSFLLGTRGDSNRALRLAFTAFQNAKSPEKRWVLADAVFWILKRTKPAGIDPKRIEAMLAAQYLREYDPDVRLKLADSIVLLISNRADAQSVPKPQ